MSLDVEVCKSDKETEKSFHLADSGFPPYLKYTVAQLVWCDNICTYKCEILVFLHQGKGATTHQYRLFSFSTTKTEVSWDSLRAD